MQPTYLTSYKAKRSGAERRDLNSAAWHENINECPLRNLDYTTLYT